MKQLIEDLISAMEYHVEQTRPVHMTTVAIQAAKDALKAMPAAQPAPMQEPVAQDVQEKCRIETVPAKGGLLPTPPAPQPVPVKTYHNGKPWAPKPWVGLSEKDKTEIRYLSERDDRDYVMALVEAKLKEKNHG
jgi:hypothetical protein